MKGPSRFGANIGLTTFLLRFQASSHTLSLTLKGVNLVLTRSFMSSCAILCAASASFLASLRMFSHSSTAGSWAVSIISGRAWGLYPIIR